VTGVQTCALPIFDPTLRDVADDDDSGGGGNARIVYTATSTGPHYLAALDFDLGTGAYLLSASTADNVAPTLQGRTPADDSTQVATNADLVFNFSETVLAGSGRIRLVNSENQVLREIRAGDANAVRINGSTVTIDPGENLPADTVISVLVDADAFRDAAGNAYAGITSATAWNFRTAPAASGDDFPLSVNTSGVVPTTGAAVAGRIDYANDGDLFKVSLQAGVTYRFDMFAPASVDVDPYLVLYGQLPEVDYITYDDDSGGDFNAQLYFTPSASGTYYLAAYDYAEATGPYTLSAAVPTDDWSGSTAAGNRGRVTVNGSSGNGEINVPSDIDMFAITLSAGSQVTIDLKSSGSATRALEDPYLVLLDAQGQALAYDDDTGGGLNSQITVSVTQSGTYYLAAADFDTGAGQYQLSAFTRNVIPGSNGSDELDGSAARDTLQAGAGDDAMRGGAADDILDGGEGIDFAVFNLPRASYALDGVEGGWAVTAKSGNEGRDLLYDVERIAFDDGFLALDIDGSAGQVARILGAVFGPASVGNAEYVGIGLALRDAGMAVDDLMQLAIDARLGPNASNSALVNLLYANVVGVLPTTQERLYFEGLLTSGAYTRAELGLLAADTDLNADNIGLAGLLETGLAFVL
jgi:Ca2+-binding RTX toxin-like protein